MESTPEDAKKRKEIEALKSGRLIDIWAAAVFAAVTAFAGHASYSKMDRAEYYSGFENNAEKRAIVVENFRSACRSHLMTEADAAPDEKAVTDCAEKNADEFITGSKELQVRDSTLLAGLGVITLGVAGFYGRKYKMAGDAIAKLEVK